MFDEVFAEFHGNAEKFYCKFYKVSIEFAVFKFSSKLPIDHSPMLLCTELATLCLDLLANGKQHLEQQTKINVVLTEKDVHCLQYLAGYCFHNLYAKLRKSKNCHSEVSQMWLSILIAAKSEKEQPVVDAKNRGGLWKVHGRAIDIFKVCEREFVKYVSTILYKIDNYYLVEKLSADCLIKSAFGHICGMTEEYVDKEIAKNLLDKLLLLYIRLRSHSFAKKLKEKYKAEKQSTKKKALRTNIKRTSSRLELGH